MATPITLCMILPACPPSMCYCLSLDNMLRVVVDLTIVKSLLNGVLHVLWPVDLSLASLIAWPFVYAGVF